MLVFVQFVISDKIINSRFFSNHYLFGFILFRSRMFIASLFRLGERSIEYPWLLKNFKNYALPGTVLDVGSRESFLGYEFLWRGFIVFGVDIRKYLTRPKLMNYFCADVTRLPFHNELFENIEMVSTIEHIGVGLYADEMIEENSDYDTMHELQRVLKPNGRLFITTPFNFEYELAPGARLYDMNRIRAISGGLNLLKVSFFARFKSSQKWKELSEVEASKITKMGGQGLVCLIFEK